MNAAQPAHLLRRLGAICYDTLLLLAVLFIAGLPLPLIPEPIRMAPAVRYATFIYELLISFVFFGWFWTHGGQTLGMRAWRVRLVDADGAAPGWKRAGRRFAWSMVSWAALGSGFLWSLVDPRRRTWHDLLSGTRLVHIPPGSIPPQQNRTDAQEQAGR